MPALQLLAVGCWVMRFVSLSFSLPVLSSSRLLYLAGVRSEHTVHHGAPSQRKEKRVRARVTSLSDLDGAPNLFPLLLTVCTGKTDVSQRTPARAPNRISDSFATERCILLRALNEAF